MINLIILQIFIKNYRTLISEFLLDKNSLLFLLLFSSGSTLGTEPLLIFRDGFLVHFDTFNMEPLNFTLNELAVYLGIITADEGGIGFDLSAITVSLGNLVFIAQSAESTRISGHSVPALRLACCCWPSLCPSLCRPGALCCS